MSSESLFLFGWPNIQAYITRKPQILYSYYQQTTEQLVPPESGNSYIRMQTDRTTRAITHRPDYRRASTYLNQQIPSIQYRRFLTGGEGQNNQTRRSMTNMAINQQGKPQNHHQQRIFMNQGYQQQGAIAQHPVLAHRGVVNLGTPNGSPADHTLKDMITKTMSEPFKKVFQLSAHSRVEFDSEDFAVNYQKCFETSGSLTPGGSLGHKIRSIAFSDFGSYCVAGDLGVALFDTKRLRFSFGYQSGSLGGPGRAEGLDQDSANFSQVVFSGDH